MSEPESAQLERPRVLMVGRARIRFPLSETALRRYDALSAELDWRQIGTEVGQVATDARFVLWAEPRIRPLRGVAFLLTLPLRVARELRRFRPEVVIVQGAQETGLVLLGRALARSSARVVLDLHGDWRVPTRLYGSRWRALLTPISDALAGLAVRRADAVRTITPFTSGLVRAAGREPDAEFPAFMDLEAFTDQPVAPLPLSPTALFVGVLEPYKAIDILAAGWPIVAGRVEGATLRIVGKGTLEGTVQRLVDADPRVGWDRELSATEVARALDAAAVLVLPSRSEGMGRIVVEAFCRGRPVVGSSVGGIPDLVRNGENGLLVTPGDATALADALASVLSDRMLLERLSRGALAAAGAWTASPAEWATRMRRLVDKVAAQAGSSASNSP